ncbi:hypothetical protein Tco_0318908 [Tanacetum coccineum]
MYKEYLDEFWYSAKALENSKVSFSIPTGGIHGVVGVNTFRNAIGAYYLPHSSEYVTPPSIDIVRPLFETIRYGEAIPDKGTLKKSLLPPRWSLANGINIDYANIFWEDIIIKLNKKHREKVVSYTRFLSLLIMHKMKEGYRDDEISQWSLKLPKTSSKAESVSHGTNPGAQIGHKKPLNSSKQPSVSSKEATKGGSSKPPTSSKTVHSKKRKEFSSTMESKPIQPLVSTTVDPGMHEEDQQATGGPTSLGVTSEAGSNPQLSSGMLAFNLNEPIYSASFIIHSESMITPKLYMFSMELFDADLVVAPTPGSAITILETANEFAIKDMKMKPSADDVPFNNGANQKTWLDELNEGTIKAIDETSNHFHYGRNDYNRDNYRSNTDDKPYDLQKQFNDFMKSQQSTNAFVKETFMDLKNQLETVAKNHQASIQNLETKFDRLADKQSSRPSGSLPSNTQPNLKGHNSKAYQPPQSRNEHVNAVFTRSGKSYNSLVNPNDQQNDSENPINFNSNDEDEEPTPQPKI